MAKWPHGGDRLTPVQREWGAEPITVCALFSGAARLTPKVQVLLDFLGEYLGTDRDPRLLGLPAKGMFTDPMTSETSGP
jgi:LysR family transcriptional activator of dmlA